MDPGIKNLRCHIYVFKNTLNYFLCVILGKFQPSVFPTTPPLLHNAMIMAFGLNKNHDDLKFDVQKFALCLSADPSVSQPKLL